MKIDWHLDQDAGLVYLKYSGTADFAYWSATMRSILAHEHYRPGFGFVAEIDGSLVPDASHLTQVLDFVERHATEFAGSRWANVTVNPAHYGMTRVAQARSHDFPSELAAFTTVAEAERWARSNAHHGTEDRPPHGDESTAQL